MSLKNLITIMAVFSLIWGIGFIIFPVQVWSLYGIAIDADGIYIARELGVVFLMLGAILWFSRNDPGSKSLRAIVLGLSIGNGFGFIVTLIGQLSTDVSALGWVGVAFYLLLALSFGYHLLKPAAFLKSSQVEL
jgi:hypothetical protein